MTTEMALLFRAPFLAFSLAFSLAACTGGGDAGFGGDGNGTDSAEPMDPTFTVVYDEVLAKSCAFSSCHGGNAGHLTLSEEGSWTALVNMPSSAVDGEVLVIPGDPDASYILKKLEEAGDIEGDPMPPSASLDQAKLDLVREWIWLGALDD